LKALRLKIFGFSSIVLDGSSDLISPFILGILIETVPKKTENSIVKNQRKSKSLIFTGSKIFAGQ
jgi:hypothetical protein